MTGLAADGPSWQSEASTSVAQISSKSSISPSLPRPSVMPVKDYFTHLPQAFTARQAFAAGLALEEGGVIAGHVHHAGLIVHDNHAAGTHHRAGFCQFVEVHRQVEQAFRNNAAGRTAGLYRLEFTALGNAAADIEDDFAERRAHRDFDQPGIGNVADEREYLGAFAACGTYLAVPVSAVVDNQSERWPMSRRY